MEECEMSKQDIDICQVLWDKLRNILDSNEDDIGNYYGLFDCTDYLGTEQNINHIKMFSAYRLGIRTIALTDKKQNGKVLWHYCQMLKAILQTFDCLNVFINIKHEYSKTELANLLSNETLQKIRPHFINEESVSEESKKECELHLYVLREFLLIYEEARKRFDGVYDCINYLIEKKINLDCLQNLISILIQRKSCDDKEHLLNCLIYMSLMVYDSVVMFLIVRNMSSEDIEEMFTKCKTKENEDER